jgi:hypothetical protein
MWAVDMDESFVFAVLVKLIGRRRGDLNRTCLRGEDASKGAGFVPAPRFREPAHGARNSWRPAARAGPQAGKRPPQFGEAVSEPLHDRPRASAAPSRFAHAGARRDGAASDRARGYSGSSVK